MGDNGDIDALLRRASRIAEHIFKDCGSLDPIWLIELADGKQEIIATPILAPDGSAAEYKHFLDKRLRELFVEKGVRRYASAMECWHVENVEEEIKPIDLGRSIHNHPHRKEVILIEADDGSRRRVGIREIIRTRGDVCLGKLNIEDSVARGRFLNLLGKRQLH